MKAKILKSEQEYNDASDRIYGIINGSKNTIDPDSPKGEELELLSLKMITLLNRYLGIPLESLIHGNNKIKLEAEKKAQLLNISSIQEYFKNHRTAML